MKIEINLTKREVDMLLKHGGLGMTLGRPFTKTDTQVSAEEKIRDSLHLALKTHGSKKRT